MPKNAGKRDRVLAEVRTRLGRAADEVVPWFFDNMPEYYFRTHSEGEQVAHLQAVISGRVVGDRQTVRLMSPCGTRLTHIAPEGGVERLIPSLEELAGQRIVTARIYVSRDRTLSLDTFLVGDQPACNPDGDSFARAVRLALREAGDAPLSREEFEAFLSTATSDYVDKFELTRALRHFRLIGRIRAGRGQVVELEPRASADSDRISMAVADPPKGWMLLQVFKALRRHGLDLNRAYLDQFDLPEGRASVMSLYVPASLGLGRKEGPWERLRRDLLQAKWMAPHGLEALLGPDWNTERVLLMAAACEFAHQFLLKKDLYAYTSDRIMRTVLANRHAAKALVDFFYARFDPEGAADREVMARAREREAVAMLEAVGETMPREVFECVLAFFKSVKRTNFFLPGRSGLAFRVDGDFLPEEEGREQPYGFYFFHGPYHLCFHVRFRDMSRGGLRLVPTPNQERFELESNRLFDEAMSLALAQQQKNKDIPEGGSKAVLLLGPQAERDLAVRTTVNGLLDLIVTNADGELPPEVVDYLGHEEIIYLGPDENVTPAHIEYIVAQARRRGYRWPSALMSSKPGAGINHKRYGVTSEGVVVFARQALGLVGIDPEGEPFTVKLTGGPAGDVAGNCVRILYREFGDNARIVAMSDGHGAVYDPDGLNRAELMRLVAAGERTSAFDPDLLAGDGAFKADTSTEAGAKRRDDLHNTAPADLFIPAGGRPDTINMRNWERFLDKDGAPSAKAIVEGANIFISPEARARLEQAGVLVVPGPSANKTGVICSSYEILAGLMLSEEEFLAVKDRYVAEVLDILRKRAGDEAELLAREHRLCGGRRSLTLISTRISRAANRLADAILPVLDDLARLERTELDRVMLMYCPPVLAEKFGDRLAARVPEAHRKALLAKHLSSDLLYREGLDWMERLSGVRQVSEFMAAYLEERREAAALVEQVLASDLPGKQALAAIIRSEGTKHLTMRRLGLM